MSILELSRQVLVAGLNPGAEDDVHSWARGRSLSVAAFGPGLRDLSGAVLLGIVAELGACAGLRGRQPSLPIIFVGASGEDEMAAFEAGATEFVGPPASWQRIARRAEALLRVQGADADPPVLECASLRIDTLQRRVLGDGRELPLTRIEYDLVLALARRPDQPLSFTELARAAFGDARGTGLENRVRQRMYHLGKKLGRARSLITAARGHGYVLHTERPALESAG
jgi:two-component system response regulator MtrA